MVARSLRARHASHASISDRVAAAMEMEALFAIAVSAATRSVCTTPASRSGSVFGASLTAAEVA